MATRDVPIVLADLSGGQNSADPPLALGPTQAIAVVNVEWHRSKFGRKRRGSRLIERESGMSALPTDTTFVTMAGVQRPTNGLTPNPVGLIVETFDFRWVSWGYDTGYDWVLGNVSDTPLTHACVVYFAGRWFAAFKSAADRLHTIGTGVFGFNATGYRVGIGPPLAAPVISEAAGSVTDLRKYRHCFCSMSGTVMLMRSEPGPETLAHTLTAEQASAAAPGAAPAGENYNAWELQVASDDDTYATWWVVGQALTSVAIVDNNTSLLVLEPAPELGLHEPPHSAKYLGVDDNRMLMAGAYEQSTDPIQQSRVWFTPVEGDLGIGDGERVPDTVTGQRNWVDVDAGDQGGEITGFGPATLGDILVFKRAQLWRLVRTGNVDAPYIPRAIDKSIGTFGYRTISPGQDAAGGPCVYFASARGPMRVGHDSVQYLGAAIEDVWQTVNQYANVHTSQHGTYYPNRGQYWLWVSVGTSTVPSVLLVYTVATNGWAVYTGPLATAQASALWPRFVQEPNKGVPIGLGQPHPSEKAEWVPYCAPTAFGQIAECDAINPQTGVALATDLELYSGAGTVWTPGTSYQGYLTTRPLPQKELDSTLTVQGAHVIASAQAGVVLTLGIVRDYGAETRTFTCAALTAAGTETIVIRRFDAAETANARALHLTIGDGAAAATQWALHALQMRVMEEFGR
jgi:hypothetical protein